MSFNTLQFRLSALVFAFGLLLIGMSVVKQYKRDIESSLQQIRLHSYQEGTRLAGLAQHFLRRQLPQSADLAISYASVHPDLRLGVIADGDDRIRNATQKQWRGVSLWDSPLEVTPELIKQAKEAFEGLLHEDVAGRRLTAIVPFLDVMKRRKNGVVILEYDLSAVLASAADHVMQESISQSCVLFGGCLLLWSLLRLLVTERVTQILNQTHHLGSNESMPPALGGNDELAAISGSIAESARRLQASEWRFSQIASHMRDIFWVAPPDSSEPIYVNAAYEKLFGRPSAQLQAGRWDWLKAVAREDRHAALSMLQTLRNGAEVDEIEIRIHGPERVEWVRCRGFSASRGDDKPGHFQVAGMAVVVTKEKEMEKRLLESAESERRRIGQDLHDDVCQRLAAAQLKSGVLGGSLKRSGHPQAELAADVAGELAEASEIARGYARGLAPVAVSAGDLPDALDDLRKFLERAFTVRCHVTCSDIRGAVSTQDAAQIFRIIQELATNAAKHAHGTWVQITLTLAQHDLRVEVANDGQPFDRAMNSGRRGMGLHMLRQRVDALGASLSYQPRSAADGGTLAVCEIPLGTTSATSSL